MVNIFLCMFFLFFVTLLLFRYASIAAIRITATKRWRSTRVPPFSFAQTTTEQRHFHLPIVAELLITAGWRPSFWVYSHHLRFIYRWDYVDIPSQKTITKFISRRLKYIEKFKKEKVRKKFVVCFKNGNDRRGAGYLLPLKT